MKILKILIPTSLLLILLGCKAGTDCDQIIVKIEGEIGSGNLTAAIHLADSLKKSCTENKQLFQKADSLAQIAERIGIDFSVSEEQVITQIENRSGSFSKEEETDWENKGWLEMRLINGKKMYFKRAASNLMLLKKFYEQKEEWLRENKKDPNMIFRLKYTEAAYKASDNQCNPIVP